MVSSKASEEDTYKRLFNSSDYITVRPGPNDSQCRLFFREFPYSLLSIRRKEKDSLGNVKSDLKYVRELDQDFEAKYWDVDNRVIACVQRFYVNKRGMANKLIGGLFLANSVALSCKHPPNGLPCSCVPDGSVDGGNPGHFAILARRAGAKPQQCHDP